MEVTTVQKILKSIIKAVITLVALTIDYGLVADEISFAGYENPETMFGILSKLLYSMELSTITALLLLFFLTIFYLFLYRIEKLPGRTEAGVCILALAAAFSAMIGKLFYIYKDIGLLTRGTVQLLKGALVLSGLFLLFAGLIRLLVYGFTQYCEKPAKKGGLETIFGRKYSALLITSLLLAAWLPTIIAYYPAVFMGDSEDIIYMAYNYPSGIENSVLPLKEGFYVTNHHPVLYTGYVSLILHGVRAFGGSYNLGIFLCAMIQAAITLCILVYSCMYCANRLKNERLALVMAVFYALFPLMPKYAMMITKDTFFADILLLWAILVHKAVHAQNANKDMIQLTAASVAVVFIRKNGIYVIILTLVLAAVLYKQFWKRWLLVLAVVLSVNTIYSSVILPMAKIPDGSIREMLSVPFQQTARYVKYHGDEVTEEERQAIAGVLDYDKLADLYWENLSDPVKNTYNKAATKEELKAYFAVWFQMFFKHPEEYAAAFLNNYYGYFYPVVNDAMKHARTSVGSIQNVNRDGYFDFSHCYDKFHIALRDALTFYDLLWMKLPVLNMLMTSALYVWGVLIVLFLAAIRRHKTAVLAAVMYLGLIFTVLVGPSNAINYERYVFPCILGMPYLISLILSENERSIKNG